MGDRRLHVRLLGGFELEADGRTVPADVWRRRRRAATLVKILALAPDHRLSRHEVMAALWPELDAAAAGRNLRKAAYHARRLVGVEDVVVLDGATVALLPGATVTTDAGAFAAALQAVLSEPMSDRLAVQAREVSAAYPGPLLPDDRGEPWRDAAADDLERRYREVLVRGRQWGRLLAFDPTSEAAHRAIVRERLEAGDRAGAIRQFDEMRRVLRDEFGVGPGPASVALYEEVLAAEGRDVPTPAERARALLAWGVVHWERADLVEAARAADEARALAIDAGLGRELADASELRGLVAYAQGRWQEVFAHDFVTMLESRPALLPFIYDANLCMSEFALHEPLGLERMAAFADDLLAVAANGGSLQARSVGLLLRGEVGLLAGDDPEVVRPLLRQARVMHDATASPVGLALTTEREAQMESEVGNVGRAAELHARALELAVASPVAGHLLPLIYGGMLAGAAVTEGQRILLRAADALAGVARCDPCSMSFHVGAAEVCAAAGALGEARRHLTEAERISGMWSGGPWLAAVHRTRASVRAVEGAPVEEVRAALDAAAATFEATGRRRDAAHCRSLLTGLA